MKLETHIQNLIGYRKGSFIRDAYSNKNLYKNNKILNKTNIVPQGPGKIRTN
jgi:hypothetical protein